MPQPKDIRLMSSQVVPLFARHLAAHGVDVKALLRRFDLPPNAGECLVVDAPLTTVRRFCDACAVAVRNPALGFHVALQVPRGTYGLLEYLARNAATLGDAFERFSKFGVLLNDVVRIEIEKTPTAICVRHQVSGDPLAVGPQCNVFFVTIMISLARQLCGDSFTAKRVWLAHPGSPQPLATYARCPIKTGTGTNGLAIAPAELKRPVVGADPALLSLLEQLAGEQAGQRTPEARLVDRVSALTKEALAHGGPIVERVAQKLHMSARTLQRRLREEGVQFQAVLEQTRRDLAGQLEGASHDEIAWRLGYANVRSFARARARWAQR